MYECCIQDGVEVILNFTFNPLTPKDLYMNRTAPLTSKRYILYIYSTNVGTEYFKHALHSPSFSFQNAVCFIMLTCLVSVLFTFYMQGVLKFKKNNTGAKGLTRMKCMYLSNTTLFDGIYIYINLLHKDQLHISVPDDGHLQVEIEKLSKQLYSTYVGSIQPT